MRETIEFQKLFRNFANRKQPKNMQQNYIKYNAETPLFVTSTENSCSPLLCYRFVSTTLIAQIPAKTLSQTHRICFMLLCYNHAKTTTFSAQSSTGKERDSETGFSYCGARYYDSDILTGWLSVDPMADKYPGLSPYAYCAWNPIRLVDPDGRDVWEVDEHGYIKNTSNEGGTNQQTVKFENGNVKKFNGKTITLL